jgi:nicotinate dehydrogenase medium molybdopterin subunit
MKRRGVGYSSMFYGTGYGNGFPDESRATAKLNSEGKITIFVSAAEVGQGALSIMWQIASETLKIDFKDIIIENNKTEFMKDSGTAAASRQTYNTGNAVMDACNNFKDNMELAFKRKGTDRFYIEEGIVYGDEYIYTLANVHDIMMKNDISIITEGYFKADTTSLDLETGQGNPYWPYVFGVQKAVVEVDDETGKVDVIDIVACHDSGKIINPNLAKGQIQGGCAMGIGYALMEELDINRGVIKNKNFSNYIIPTSMDVPNVKVFFVEEEEKTGPFGAKGLGEAAMIPTAPAILNAIYDAINVRIFDLPATSERVLEAIKNKEK